MLVFTFEYKGNQKKNYQGYQAYVSRWEIAPRPRSPSSGAAHTETTVSFRWEEFDHPAYSPDLAPSDYHPFQYLKRFLAGQHFPSDDDMQTAVTSLQRGLLRHRHDEISVMV
ncbi:hypothetical protein AVEN_155743-1 [Araneus ventricosus]|uniref:Histone-lysine N-methyltransferase SETMAR n=1 Tax=Araneus ventricosus TaxID=182803 RepID=A0A4Y2L8M2_ARAVE|nr:hypothetical protein AVEN_155743-1 [Araneus ventricosus]